MRMSTSLKEKKTSRNNYEIHMECLKTDRSEEEDNAYADMPAPFKTTIRKYS